MTNSMIVIFPYRHNQTWVFDDERVGLLQEPFISGVPEMIDILVADIPNVVHEETRRERDAGTRGQNLGEDCDPAQVQASESSIQTGFQTPGTSVPDTGLETHQTLRVSVSLRPRVIFDEGFKLIFSANPFPGYQAEIYWVKEEYGGHWYRWEQENMQGWLCPAMFKYFAEAPKKIYCKAESLY